MPLDGQTQARSREWWHFCSAEDAVNADSAVGVGGRWTQGMLPMGFGEILWEDAAAGMKSLSVNRPRGSFFLLGFRRRHSREVVDKVLSFVLFFPPFLSSREEERKKRNY